jgi:hypothetical protein
MEIHEGLATGLQHEPTPSAVLGALRELKGRKVASQPIGTSEATDREKMGLMAEPFRLDHDSVLDPIADGKILAELRWGFVNKRKMSRESNHYRRVLSLLELIHEGETQDPR